MKIKNLKPIYRPREKMLLTDISNLSDAEILAVILRTGNQNESAIELAYKILSTYDIEYLNTISINELCKIPGIGIAKACSIKACYEFVNRSIKKDNNIILSNSKQIFEYIKNLYLGMHKEIFYIILLDSKCKLIKYIKLGISDSSSVYIDIKSILREVINYESRCVVLVHNHPSGDVFPSSEDYKTTKMIKEKLEDINVLLLDHIIISNNKYYSFNEQEEL